MANAYIDLATIKGSGGLNLATGTLYDKRLVSLSEDISRQVDRYCNRHFYYRIATLDFDGDGSQTLLLPDLISVSGITEDTNFDGTFETTWNGTDYVLSPAQSNPTRADEGRPYTFLQVNLKSNGLQDVFLRGQSMYRIVGTWGFWKVSKDSGLNGTLANSTATNLVLSGSATGTVEIGHTLLIEDELVFVSAAGTGTNMTVERGINNTVAATHTDKDINVILYPGPVVEAVFVQMARLWRRKDSAFASSVGMPETGQMMTWTGGLDRDVQDLLKPYRKWAV